MRIYEALAVFCAAFLIVGALGFAAHAQGPPSEPLERIDCQAQHDPRIAEEDVEPEDILVCAEKKGGSWTNSMISAPQTLNPVTAQDTASDAIIDHNLGVFFNDYSNPAIGGTEPQAASKIEVSEEGNAVTYTLREGLKFSDGSPVTVEDVLFWYYNIIWDPNIPNSQMDAFTCPDGSAYTLTTPGERQITVSCPEQFRTFLTFADDLLILSKQMALDFMEDQGVGTSQAIAPGPNGVLDTSASGDDVNFRDAGVVIGPGDNGTLDTSPSGDDVVIEQPVGEFMGLGIDVSKFRGLGPYVMTNLQTQQIAEYEPNPFFYEVDSNGTQLPYLDTYRIIIIPTQGQNLAITNFLNGTTDAIGPRPQDVSPILSQAAAGGFAVNQDIDSGIPDEGEEFVTLNFDDTNPNLAAAARNPKVRKALSLAIDRVALVNNVRLGIGVSQYTPATIAGTAGDQFFLGRNNTCEDFIDAGLATADTCSDGVWALPRGLSIRVNSLPDPSVSEYEQLLSCLTDYEGCVAQAKQLLDEVGIVDEDGDGVRDIPAGFSDVIDNPGGPFEIQVTTNTGNTIREEDDKIICDGWNNVGINCQAVTTSFPTLVRRLLGIGGAEWTGAIRIGLTGGDPAGGLNVWPCGTALHFWHLQCDPNATEGPNARTPGEKAVEDAWQEGFSAKTVEEAQPPFDQWQIAWAKYEPFIHTATGNVLFAVRTDRICNHGRAIVGNDDVKFRLDIDGQTSCPRPE